MRKRLSIFIYFTLLIYLATLTVVMAAPPASRLPHPVRSYVLYYGRIGQNQLDNLKKFDLAIVEPRAISDAQIKELKEAHTLVIGYVPLTSIDQAESPITGLEEQDYLHLGGQKVENNENNPPDWITNPTSTHYRHLVVDYTKQLYGRGFNGVLLDTVSEATDFSRQGGEAFQQRVLEGTQKLVREIRNIDQNKLLIQNGGWWQKEPYNVISRTAPYIDFLLWEGYDLHLSTQNTKKLTKVKELVDEYNFGLLACYFYPTDDFTGVEQFYGKAKDNNFVPYAPWLLNGVKTYVNPTLNLNLVPARSVNLPHYYCYRPFQYKYLTIYSQLNYYRAYGHCH